MDIFGAPFCQPEVQEITMPIPCSCGIFMVPFPPVSAATLLSLVMSLLSGLLPQSCMSPFLCSGQHWVQCLLGGPGLLLAWDPHPAHGKLMHSWPLAPVLHLIPFRASSLQGVVYSSQLLIFIVVLVQMFTLLTVSGFLIIRSYLHYVALLTTPSCLHIFISLGIMTLLSLIFLFSGQFLLVYFPGFLFSLSFYFLYVDSSPLVFFFIHFGCLHTAPEGLEPFHVGEYPLCSGTLSLTEEQL